MASPCCPPGSLGAPPPDGSYTHKGRYESIAGLDCYVVGASPAKVVILSFSDLFPCLLDRKREVCDLLAAAIPGSQVIAMDFFRGRPIREMPNPNAGKLRVKFGMLCSVPGIIYRLKFLHNWSSMKPMLEGLTRELRSRSPDAHFLCYGYCFGGYVVCKVCSYMGYSAGVGYHPSMQVAGMQPAPYKQSAAELAGEVKCPVLLLLAGNDPPMLKLGCDFMKRLPAGSGTHTYDNMYHGFMSRGAVATSALERMLNDAPPAEIAAAQADALRRTIDFFKEAISQKTVPCASIKVKRAPSGYGRLVLALLVVAAATAVGAYLVRGRSLR